MTVLRWIGLGIGVLLFVVLFLQGRRGRIRGLDLFIGLMAAVGLGVFSVFPEVIGILRDMLALDRDQFSRLIALAIVSNILLWVLLIASRVRATNRTDQFDYLVRSLAASEFERRYPELSALPPVLIAIPAFNEADNIGSVVEGMPETVCGLPVQALVIDDGSEDRIADVVRSLGVPVVRSPLNRGQGAALRIASDIAIRHGAEIMVTMDADGQHLVEDLEGVVAPLVADEADFVIGSRILGQREKDSLTRYTGIHTFNMLIRLLTPLKVTDCSSGYRALRVSSLSKLLLRQDQYFAPELIIEAARRGVRVGEAPIVVKRRASGKSKKGRNLYYAYAFARSIFKTWWRR